jgi:hypothetical protein
VIDINLNEANPQTVVDAKLFNGTKDFIVKLNQTTDYYNPQPYETINNAIVTIADENGNINILEENVDGEYILKNFEGVTNKSYSLEILLTTGEKYISTALLPNVVQLDDIIFDFEEQSLFGESGFVPYCVFQEPVSEKNFYRIVITVNGKRKDAIEDLFITDDELINGNQIVVPLFSERLKIGDTVTMELITMDENVFNYLETLSSIAGGAQQQSAAPANPNTNISGGALGYFGAYSTSSLTKVVE